MQKTDPRDARNLGLRLQSGVLHSIHIPDEQQEADRVFFRHRKRIWKDLTRCINRIKGLLAFSGIDIRNNMIMPVGVTILSTGLRHWIVNNKAEEEHWII